MHDAEYNDTVSVGGQSLSVCVRRGQSAATPLLLLNGIGAGLELFEPLVAALHPDIEIIRFDVPGVGGSPSPLIPYSFSALACLTEQLLHALGYGQVDVLGFSWGGALAQHFALQHPGRCRRLILLNTGTGALMVPGGVSSLIKLLLPPRSITAPNLAAFAHELAGDDRLPSPHVLAPFARSLRACEARDYWYLLSAIAGWTSLPWLPLVTQPTLIIAGRSDPLVPVVNAEIMDRLIPRSELYIYPGGHLGLLTRPGELARRIETFVLEVDPS